MWSGRRAHWQVGSGWWRLPAAAAAAAAAAGGRAQPAAVSQLLLLLVVLRVCSPWVVFAYACAYLCSVSRFPACALASQRFLRALGLV